MLRFGNISAIDEVKGRFKVTFDEDDLVSGWLPYLVKNTKENKDECFFDQGEHVACLMDDKCEHGVILGATNTDTDKPILGDKDIRRTTYKDGSFVQFDRQNKKLTVSCEGDVEVIKSKNVNVKADTKVTIDAPDIELKGKLKVTDDATFQKDITATTGDITASVGDIKATTGDVMALTHSLSNHVHLMAPFTPTGPPTP